MTVTVKLQRVTIYRFADQANSALTCLTMEGTSATTKYPTRMVWRLQTAVVEAIGIYMLSKAPAV